MIAGFKLYPAMKDSGVEWLGEVPEHWEVSQLGRIGTFSKGNGGTKEDEVARGVPCVRYGDLYTRHRFFVEETKARVANDRAADYTPIQFGDVLFAGSGETIEEIGKSAVNLLSEPARCGGDVIIFRPSVAVDAKFLGLSTDCPQAAYQKSCMGRGITVMHIYGDELKYLSIALPPLPEQAAIVRYLDHVDRRVRRLVRAKRKLIVLLTEQKQSIIHRAVTRGLDPDVPLKDSGVEWLAEVAAHWEVARLKDVAVVQTGITLGKNYKDLETTSYPYLRVANVQVGRLDLREVKQVDIPLSEAKGATLRYGDVLMTEGGDVDKLGRGCVWHGEIAECLHQNHVFAVRCRPDRLDPEFLAGLMASGHGRAYFQLTAKQTTNLASTNSTTLRASPIMLPKLSEQRAILQEIQRLSASIDSALRDAQCEIDLLNEYRTRLIADVVTGKLDVREAAAALPEVDLLVTDGEPDSLDAEAEAGLDDLDAIPEEAET